ncbi:MAG: hypothetical protein D6782_01345, partial [Alphaproteobacteria bacterium]
MTCKSAIGKTALAAALGGVVACPAQADSAGNIFDQAFSQAKPVLAARLRYEGVDQDGIARNADALTLRVRAGLVTGAVADTQLGFDFEWIESINGDFNSTTNGRTQFPVVADPQDVELNQLYLQNKSLPATTITLGRQRVTLDDHRFIGNVGWRQNEQTYDAVRLSNTALAGLTIDLLYLNQVNRVFGPDSPASPWHGDSFLANLSYAFAFGKLTAFAYLIEVDQVAVNSSQTYGLRFAGARNVGAAKVRYALSYASQSDDHDNPVDYRADYYYVDAGVDYAGASLGVAYEVLDG